MKKNTLFQATKTLPNDRLRWLIGISIIAGVLLTVGLLLASRQAGLAAEQSGKIYIPLILHIAPFYPTTDTTLPGGVYTFQSVNIPANVTVTVGGPITITVLQETLIAGKLAGDCASITLRGQGSITVTGTLDNRCSTNSDTPGDLAIHQLTGGGLALGTTAHPAHLHTSGNLDVSNDPALQEWEFDVPPDQRSVVPFPPVCAASADTLVASVTPGYPAEVSFTGEGADPDGGPVTYAWDFGDGATAAGRYPVHSFSAWGAYPITLTVTDDENTTCQAILHLTLDDGEANLPPSPGAWATPTDLVVEAAQPADFSALALDPQGQELTYFWEFGDALTSSLPSPTHTYTLSGRYPITLTVTDAEGESRKSSGAVYVYSGPHTYALPQIPAQGNCLAPGPNVFNVIFDGGAAVAGRDGRKAIFRGRGDIFLGAATDIHAQDGGNGANRSGAGTVVGGRGGRGGSLQVLVNGHLIVCAGARLAAGNGGEGGNATSVTPPSGLALARSGNGGAAAHLLRIASIGQLDFQAPAGGFVTLEPGNGGNGGLADATGEEGAAQCPTGQAGASARATGGNGGRASKAAIITGAVGGLGNVQIDGGRGGIGGNANAEAGKGGDATCLGSANGGLGKPATAFGGQGGEAKLTGMAAGFALAADAFTAGDGGNATAWGGDGGNATAIPPAACADATATGGQAGNANARGGNGGNGRIPANGGDADALGGEGGSAVATGGDCTACGNGGVANATGGRAGNSDTRFGKRGGAAAADGTATSYAYDGGDATATGGRGGDCPTCPAGNGGDGGPATAIGGQGGTATGNGLNDGGNGGPANATGGRGGDGADCCEKFNEQPGGNGGEGGPATSTAGAPGTPGGADGGNGVVGGDGGNGGNGLPPGSKGSGGIGSGAPVDIPDGADGLDGGECPPWIIWFIYHSSIPDGAIIPGTTITLTVYPTNTTSIPPVGVVPTHFLTPEEFGHPTQYMKLEDRVLVQSGGIHYALSQLPPTFPVLSAQAHIEDTCGTANCIQLIGYYQGQEICRVYSQAGTGEETLQLPPPPAGVPFYDSFDLIGFGPFNFDHWWIVIVDP